MEGRQSEPIKLPRGNGENLHQISYVAYSLTMKVASSTTLIPFFLSFSIAQKIDLSYNYVAVPFYYICFKYHNVDNVQ